MGFPIAFIIGAGTHVGQAVASKLKQEGYRVAVGSRNPDKAEAEKNGFLPVTLDVTKVTTIEAGFDTIRETYGSPPNVVVFNRRRSILVEISISHILRYQRRITYHSRFQVKRYPWT